MYGYIYKGTILTNNKIYVGQHKAAEFDTKYYGSGTLWKRACTKYGLTNVKIELIESCDSAEELSIREAYWIRTLNSQNRNIGYNILGDDTSPHATCGNKNGMYGKKHSAESRKKMSEAAKRRPPKTEEQRKKCGKPGRKFSDEHKAKISAALKGRRPSDNCIQAVRKANSTPFEIFDDKCNLVKRVERQKDLLAFLNITYFNKELKEYITSNKLYRGYYIRYV